jgi:uncharacterized protein (DUF2141 family)
MKFQIFKLICFASLFVLFSFTNYNDEEYNLTIKINDISVSKGELYVSVYNSKETFNNKTAIESGCVKVSNSVETLSFSLPKGKYAVMLYQDLNGNQKLDALFSIPIEPYGVSNNIKGFPSFEKAKFTFDSNKIININIKN